jgi:hypothetical protein
MQKNNPKSNTNDELIVKKKKYIENHNSKSIKETNKKKTCQKYKKMKISKIQEDR